MKTQRFPVPRTLSVLVCGLAVLVVTACERPPVHTVQRGYRGVGQEQVINPRTLAAKVEGNLVPVAQPPAAPVPILAGQTYPEAQGARRDYADRVQPADGGHQPVGGAA